MGARQKRPRHACAAGRGGRRGARAGVCGGPCGFAGDGLPVGLQIVGRMFDDAGVLAASFAYEMADPHFDKIAKSY